MLLLKRVKVCLCSLVIFALLISVNIASGKNIVDVAICTFSYPWAQNLYDKEIAVVKDAIEGVGSVGSLKLFGEGDLKALADWVKAHTDGEHHVLILTGLLPKEIYGPGNVEADDSLIEEFLDAGNTVITTSEYPFYTIWCCPANEANAQEGLRTILDVPGAAMWQGLDGWRDNPIWVEMTPTADGKRLIPSIKKYKINFPMHVENYDGTPWELETAVSENTKEDLRVEGVILNTETGGRFGGFVQAPWVGPEDVGMQWGTIMSGYLVNHYLSDIAAVEADGKLASTWGKIKTVRKHKI